MLIGNTKVSLVRNERSTRHDGTVVWCMTRQLAHCQHHVSAECPAGISRHDAAKAIVRARRTLRFAVDEQRQLIQEARELALSRYNF